MHLPCLQCTAASPDTRCGITGAVVSFQTTRQLQAGQVLMHHAAATRPPTHWPHWLPLLPTAGGAFTATPKRIMQLMAVPGVTLFHVKSHLQK